METVTLAKALAAASASRARTKSRTLQDWTDELTEPADGDAAVAFAPTPLPASPKPRLIWDAVHDNLVIGVD